MFHFTSNISRDQESFKRSGFEETNFEDISLVIATRCSELEDKNDLLSINILVRGEGSKISSSS